MLLEDELRLQAPAPDAVAINDPVTVGKPGLGKWFYWIATHYPIGITFSGPVGIWNAPDVLNVQNFVRVSWSPAVGALSYDVLRTPTAVFPSGPANIALATGITQLSWDDHGASPTSYNPSGFPHGAPVACRIYLNNRDYQQPVLQMPCVTSVTTLMFPDGTTQTTAGGGGGTVGPQGPPGPQGPAGSAVAIKGSVATVGDLPATGNTLNDAYIVESNGHLYIWNGSAWIDAGPIVGPQGPAGPVGPAGATGTPGTPGATGPAGPAGPTGATGATGSQGPPGAQGPAGPTGPAGTGSYNWTQDVTANAHNIVGLGTLGLGPGGGVTPVQIFNNAGTLTFQTNTPYGLMYLDVQGQLGLGIVPSSKLTIQQLTNNIGGGIRLVSALGTRYWDMYFGSGDTLILENDELGVAAQAVFDPQGGLTLRGNGANLTFGGILLNNSSGNLILSNGQFVGAGGVNTNGQVVAAGGFAISGQGGFIGVTDTFATADGRTATVRGGIITQLA